MAEISKASFFAASTISRSDLESDACTVSVVSDRGRLRYVIYFPGHREAEEGFEEKYRHGLTRDFLGSGS